VNVLAIETATPACATALRTNEGEELVLVVDDERHHTEALTPGIRDLLVRADITPKAIDRVVVDRGPGLFTGLRVGIATAIGFALGASADLVGVTRWNSWRTARGGRVFTAIWSAWSTVAVVKSSSRPSTSPTS